MLLRESAERIATHLAWERRLFEVLGQWSADEGDPDAARVFAVVSRHHGWRAERWAELVPVLHDVAVMAPATSSLDELVSLTGTRDRLGAAEAALAVRLGEYRAHQAATTEVADGPVRRVLRIVTDDAEADRLVVASLLLG